MLKEIMHVGLTVSNIDRSIEFYRDVLGLKFQGQMVMEGPETDRLFGRENVRVRVAYLKGNDDIMSPPVELIQFTDSRAEKRAADLHSLSISEICFKVEDIDKVYKKLIDAGVQCISEPQYLDLKDQGYGESMGLYFKDPDGIILELSQPL